MLSADHKAAAALELLAAAAGARVVATGAAGLGGEEVHDLGRLAAAPEDVRHEAHAPVGVREEDLQPGAEPVEAGLAVGREQQAVLGALAVAGEEILQARQ